MLVQQYYLYCCDNIGNKYSELNSRENPRGPHYRSSLGHEHTVQTT